jgi:hypothetical protein
MVARPLLAPMVITVGGIWLRVNFLMGLVRGVWIVFCLVVRRALILSVRKGGEFP